MIARNISDGNFDKIKLVEFSIPTPAPFIQIFVYLAWMAGMCKGGCSDCWLPHYWTRVFGSLMMLQYCCRVGHR